MLDQSRRLILRSLPDVQIYQDHEDLQVYYVVPAAPSLETEDDGRPSLRLHIYLKREGQAKVPTGGQLTLTTTLSTAAQDLAMVKRAIEAHLKDAVSGTSGAARPAPAPVRVANPEWVSGTV